MITVSIYILVMYLFFLSFCLAYLMFFFLNTKREKMKKREILKVPDEKVLALLELINEVRLDKDGKKDFKAHYFLWDEIAKIYPQTKIGHWRWKQHGNDLYIVQTSKKTNLIDEE